VGFFRNESTRLKSFYWLGAILILFGLLVLGGKNPCAKRVGEPADLMPTFDIVIG